LVGGEEINGHGVTTCQSSSALSLGASRSWAKSWRLVRQHRLATLTGAGGCRKTRLALRAAADLVDADAIM
jgi:hypothetical protein